MTKEAISTERALKLALDALDEFCELGAIIRPLEVRDALRVALASRGEEHMMQVTKVWWDGEKLMAKPIPFVEFYKPIPATELREQEPVAWLEILRNNKTSSDEVIGAFLRGHAEYLTGEAFVITSPPAQPQQEPVAYAVYHRMGGGKSLHWPEQHSPDGDANEYQLVPLYKFPPAQRTWVHATTWRGLTDEDIDLFINGRGDEDDEDYVEPTGDGFGLTDDDLVQLVRRSEAKLKEKNT